MNMGALIAAHIPAFILMVMGFILIVIEMYMPGFGVPGVSGIILMIVGIALMQPTPLETLVLVLVSLALLAAALSLAMHSMAKGRMNKSKLVLNAEVNEDRSGEMDLSGCVGRIGSTRTALRPAGIAEFDGVKINDVSDGDIVAENCPVSVERVDGNRIVVRRCDEEGKPA